jgi:hypothetical protein
VYIERLVTGGKKYLLCMIYDVDCKDMKRAFYIKKSSNEYQEFVVAYCGVVYKIEIKSDS